MEESEKEPDYAHVLYRKTAERLSGRDLTPSESSGFWMGKAFGDILSDPAAYMILEVKKLFYFFNDYEMHYIASAYKEYKASLYFPLVRHGIVASLGLLGMILSCRRFKDLFLLYGMVFVYLLAGMLFLVQSRYRTPAVPFLCLFAGHSLSALREMVGTYRGSFHLDSFCLQGGNSQCGSMAAGHQNPLPDGWDTTLQERKISGGYL
jgi:hypothetical protein